MRIEKIQFYCKLQETLEFMREVLVTVPDDKVEFFMELVENLGFADVKKSGQDKTPQHIKNGLKEVQLIRTGKLPKKKIQRLLREL